MPEAGGWDAGEPGAPGASPGVTPVHDRIDDPYSTVRYPSPPAEPEGPATGDDPAQPTKGVGDEVTGGPTGGPGTAPQDPGDGPEPPETPDPSPPEDPGPRPPCARARLRDTADGFLEALSRGDRDLLALHPEVRLTVNAEDARLDALAWATGAERRFAQHFIDEWNCGSLTQAVLSTANVAVVVAVRLRHLDDGIVDIEIHLVTPNRNYFDPDAIIADGETLWLREPPANRRMGRDELIQAAERYFDASEGKGEFPQFAPACQRRQNGTPMGSGACDESGDDDRFEQRRFAVVDETLGVVSTVVVYHGYLGVYLFKIADNTIERIDIVGGAQADTSGW